MEPKRLVSALLVCVLFGVACAGVAQGVTTTAGNETPSLTIVQIAQADPDFSTLVTALQAAGLVETLSGAGPFTVFAPTNEAFEALPPGTLDALLGNKTELTRVLTHHVAPGSYLATQVIALSSLQTVQGDPLEVAVLSGGGVRVGEANIVETDIRASNGVIHVIDAVLLPAAATATPTPTATTAATTSSPSPSGFDVLPIAVTALVGLAFLVGTRGHR